MPPPNTKIIDRRHPEWIGNHLRWQWLLDSYEGGEVYRQATYGRTVAGMLEYNLRRHKREYPLPGATGSEYVANIPGYDSQYRAGEDDFQLRRAATPVPDFVHEAVEIHLAKIYATEIKRQGPAKLEAWWDDVDGHGCDIRDWLADTAAPLLLTLGQLDIVVDHPAIPADVVVRSKADQDRLKLSDAVISYILPMNMVWWSLDDRDRYAECLVREPRDDGKSNYRHWKADGWDLYDHDGEVIGTGKYRFGRPPIVRVFDRKASRHRNVGKSRYEVIADLMRSYYNRDSELILSDTTQAFPLLMGPDDYCAGDSSIPVGPGYILPMKKNNSGGTVSYQGFEVLDFPKGGADSIRQNLANIRNDSDRAACLTKPAGAAGTTGSTVAQSGISKRLDSANGNDLLSKIAGVLSRAEKMIAELVLLVLGDGNVNPADVDAIKIMYPGSFDLYSADELAVAIEQFQSMASGVGQTPELEKQALTRYYREWLPGLEKQDYDAIDAEIEAFVDAKKTEATQLNESGLTTMSGQPMPQPPVPEPLPAPTAKADITS